MMMLLEQYNMDRVLAGIVGLIAIVLALISYRDALKTKKLLRLKMLITEITLDSVTYMVDKVSVFVEKSFLCHIVNEGKFISSRIVIDDGYLTEDSHVYVKKR